MSDRREFVRQVTSAVMRQRLTFGAVVVRHRPVTVEGDSNLASLLRFELLAVDLHGIGM